MSTGIHPEDVQMKSSVWNKRLMVVRRAEALAQAQLTADAVRKARDRRGRHSR